MTDGRFPTLVDSRPEDDPWPDMLWPPPHGTALRGAVVELRVLDPDQDVAGLFTALDHDAVWIHLSGRAGTPASFAAILSGRQDAGQVPWIARLVRPLAGLPEGSVVGTSSYLEVSVPDARLEIGWTAYTPAVWAGPVNPECKLLLLGYAFDALRVGRVQLKTDVRNVRSQQAIARLGARYEATLRRYQRRADGTLRDTVLFSITAEEWPVVRDGLQTRLGLSPGQNQEGNHIRRSQSS